jgi:pyridoxal biosynthesis lyase PdxS
MMDDQTSTELLVAVGRIEEMLRNMDDKLQKLQTSEDMQWRKLNQLETEIEVLKTRQGPRVPVVSWIAGLVAAAALLLAVADRLYSI